MNLDQLFMLSPSKRLQTYYGFPQFSTCSKPLMNRPMPTFEYESDAERFSQCGNKCIPQNRCYNNYYSPFN